MSNRRPLTWIAALCWPALFLALAGSIVNLAWAFASVQDGNLVLGFIQAAAVDLGLIALAVGIAARRKAGSPTFWLWLGIAFFGAISTYGNLLHGYAHAQAVNAPFVLAVARPVVLAAVLPALVLILSEVVGYDLRGVTSPMKKSTTIEELPQPAAIPAQLPAQLPGNGDGKRQHALALLATGQFNQQQVAAQVHVHPATVSKWRKSAGNGQVVAMED